MAEKQRFQNPAVNDTVDLQLYTYNANNRADFNSVNSVDIYFLDPVEVCEENPDGRRLVSTVPSTAISHLDVGQYQVSVPLIGPTFTIGKYLDIWNVTVGTDNISDSVVNNFEVYPDLWFTAPMPPVYGFSFAFHPNKIRKGSINYLIIDIQPNMQKGTDLARYYENLAIVSPLQITIEQLCGDCIPEERDLRIIVENDPVTLRDKCVGYYLLDTTEMEKGIYQIWFTLPFGESLNISEKMELQIY